MVLPWDKLVRLALAGYDDLLSRFFESVFDLDRYPDPVRFVLGETNDLGVDFANLLADAGMAAELNGMADPLASITLKDMPVLRSWRQQYYNQLQLQPYTFLWDGINFPSDTNAWRPVTVKAVETLKTWKAVTRDQFDRMSRQQRSNAFVITKLNAKKTLVKLRDSISDAIESGTSRVNWYKSVKKDFDKSRLGPAAAELVFRVVTTKSWHEGQKKIVEENARIGNLFPYVRVFTINDARRTIACKMMSNGGLGKTSVYNRLDPAYINNRTPRHFNCFLPDTVIQGRIQKALKSFYSGDVVEIVTLNGNKLTVTANHPIATDRGFVAARELRKGVNLFSQRSGIEKRPDLFRRLVANSSNVGTFLVPSKDKENPPATIEQVFSSMLDSFGSLRSSPARADYFHGDGVFMDGKIQEVSATRILPIEFVARFLKDRVNWLLACMRMGLLFVKDFGAALHFGITGNASGSSLVCSSDLIGSLGYGHLRPLEYLRFGLASQIDAMRRDGFGDYLTTDPNFFTELVDRGSGQITLDEIVNVRQYHFSGHVYDTQTEGGWVVANNIIASNCRCRDSYMTVAQAARYGIEEAKEWQRTGKKPERFEFVPYFDVPMPPGWVPLSEKAA